MSSDPLPWRAFTFPLNVFMHILMHEEGAVRDLHYGLFERESDTLLDAQARSTELLLSRLPPPPAKLLEAGIGLGTTLRRLLSLGYDAEGITPDEHQIAMATSLPVQHAAFETFDPGKTYDAVVFQESSQYIDSEALFTRAAALAPKIIVLDEFALKPIEEEGALHSLQRFRDAAVKHGFRVGEELDLSAQAAPTMDYFTHRIPAHREQLIADLGITNEQVDHLIDSGVKYRQRYADGTYGYCLLVLTR